jgi:hypothetical protein
MLYLGNTLAHAFVRLTNGRHIGGQRAAVLSGLRYRLGSAFGWPAPAPRTARSIPTCAARYPQRRGRSLMSKITPEHLARQAVLRTSRAAARHGTSSDWPSSRSAESRKANKHPHRGRPCCRWVVDQPLPPHPASNNCCRSLRSSMAQLAFMLGWPEVRFEG